MNKDLTICQCCEYLATMIDDKELLKTIDYIEERATAMYNKLVERKEQVEELQRVVAELNSKLTRKQNLVDSQKRYIQDLEESLKEYED